MQDNRYPMLPQLSLEREAGSPLHEQLAAQLRRLIHTGEIGPGTRLPPTRQLARDLSVSRNIVVHAYEQLQLEGYLEARVGSGTRVPASLPGHLLVPDAGMVADEPAESTSPVRLSRRGERLAACGRGLVQHRVAPRPFRPGAVDPDLFPARTWGRMAGRTWRRGSAGLLPYGDPAGYGPLREAIAGHLARHRAVRCDADRVLITHGSQQALDLVSRVLLDPGEKVGVEDPGYPAAWAAFRGAGARLCPVPVDEDGASPEAGDGDLTNVRLFYTTPSHQYPLGVTMSLERRLRLLDWARRTDAWIVEDDYDSEFRYVSRPLPALQGLDRHGRVIYVGTFSKVLAPGLRLGFLVVPDHLVEPFVRARTALDYHPALPAQAVLAEFMAGGHLERHIARLRNVYRERWQALVTELEGLAGSCVGLVPGAAGLHLTVRLGTGLDDGRVTAAALRVGVETAPLTAHSLASDGPSGLVLGFGCAGVPALRDAMRRLRGIIHREVEGLNGAAV